MGKRSLSQEELKVIACITMLLDHIGAVLLPGMGLRIVGRMAFPIYCFLLAEGAHHTKNPKRYGLRLLGGAVLSELPFDLLFYGRFTPGHQSVMVTLLLGFMYLMVSQRAQNLQARLLLVLPFSLAAELLGTDYGGWGVAMISLFALTRELPERFWLQFLGLAILSWAIGGMTLPIGPVRIPIQVFSVMALIPIFLYDGRKTTNSIWIQRGFYLFYPVHLTALLLAARS